MPAPPLSNTFEGGSNATTITAANSGGASGNAFDVVNNPTTAFTFDNTHAHSGTLAAKMVTAATFQAEPYVRWNALGSVTADIWFRKYLWLPSIPATSNYLYCIRLFTGALADCCHIAIGMAANSGKVAVTNAALTDGFAVGTVNVATGQWIRLEARVRAATTNGQVEWRLFNTADSTTADDTNSSSTLALGANVDVAFMGVTNSGQPTSYTWWMDDLAVSTTDWVGPTTLTYTKTVTGIIGP